MICNGVFGFFLALGVGEIGIPLDKAGTAFGLGSGNKQASRLLLMDDVAEYGDTSAWHGH